MTQSLRLILCSLAAGAAGAAAAGLIAFAQPTVATKAAPVGPTLTVAPVIPKGNHYTCYNVLQQAPLLTFQVVLTDQFGTQPVTVRGVARMCNPTTKRRGAETSPAVDAGLHLVCYRVLQPGPVRRVEVRNQFGVNQLRLSPGMRELCLPSSKRIIPG